ncbi:MAG: type II toxin-antitoxin system RelE/ParE family toxin [Chloroflexota bacterium]
MPIKVVYAEEFFRAARKLRKRYPHVLDDVETLADQLEAGEKPGDPLQGLEPEDKAYKVRVQNRDAQRGKSGGYRVIYYLETADQIAMITIYSKTDQSDIPIQTLRHYIQEYKAQTPPEE